MIIIQCTTCKYLDTEANESPCNHCGNFNMWETQEYRTVEELEKIKTELEPLPITDTAIRLVSELINKHIAELKGETDEAEKHIC